MLKVVPSKNIPTLLIILFIVHGSIYAGMYPLWDPWDEPAHFAYIQHIVEENSIPTLDDYLSNEIVFTFDKTPMIKYWDFFNATANFQSHDFSTYWGIFGAKDTLENRELIASQPLESRTTSEPFIFIYEAHPPVGYITQVPVYLMFYDQDIITRVFALRIFSVLVSAVAAIFAYKTVSLIFPDRFMRIGSLMFIVFNPMFMASISRVNNETVTILLFSIFLYLIVLYLKGKTNTKHVILIGIVLGLGLLTKPTFMPAALLVPIFIFLRHIQNNTANLRVRITHSLKNLGIVFGITIPMVFWWYFEKFTTGNPTGHEGLPGLTFGQYIEGVFQVPWYNFIELFYISFWGDYGMSFLVPPTFFIIIVTIIVSISIVGLGLGIAFKIRHLGSKIIRDWRYQSIFTLGLSTILIGLAQSIFNIQFFIIRGDLFPAGWFIFISFTAIALVLILGYRTLIINTRLKRFKNGALFLAFIILFVFSSTTFYWLIPQYYIGY